MAITATNSIDGPTATDFRKAMAHVPTSVAIVAAVVGGERHGLFVGTLGSTSLDPLLVSFSAMKSSHAWSAIRTGSRVGISVLAAEHHELCQRFLGDRDRRFTEEDWDIQSSGIPRLSSAVVWIDGELTAIHPAGDHDLAICSVREISHREGTPALLFDRRSYSSPAFLAS